MREFLALLVIAVLAAGRADAQKPGETIEAQMGSFVHDGLNRRFILFDPKREAHPALVIMLHGAGGNALAAVSASQFIDLARKEGFVVAFPEGAGNPNAGVYAWNARNCCAGPMDRGIDDVGFVSALIDKLVANGVDPKRVYVTGISNGGMLAHRIGLELSDKIAAIAPVVGAVFGNEPPSRGPVPAMIVVGADDRIVPGSGGRVGAAGNGVKAAPAKAAPDYWARTNGCSKPQVIKEKTDTLTAYRDCSSGAEVLYYVVKGNGHAWPGNPAAPNAQPDFKASEMIWAFFKSHRKA